MADDHRPGLAQIECFNEGSANRLHEVRSDLFTHQAAHVVGLDHCGHEVCREAGFGLTHDRQVIRWDAEPGGGLCRRR